MSNSGGSGKYVLMGLAVLLVVGAIAWIGFTGDGEDGDATGAIGAANRYRADQIDEQDVVLADYFVLDSNSFHILITITAPVDSTAANSGAPHREAGDN